MNDPKPIINKIIGPVKEQYNDSVICIFGIGSYFDQTLPDDWISNDIDIIVILNDLDGTPRHEWTEVRFERKNMSGYEVWIGYNILDGVKDKNLFQAQSFSNYEWSIIELKYPENSVVLFGTNIRYQLPDIHKLEFDFDDIFRRSLYHLDRSYKTELKEKNPKKAKFQLTKAVFKFCFYLCVYHDRTFHQTSLKRITERINALKKREVIASKILIILEVCVLFRRGNKFIKPFHSLRNKFTECYA